MLLLKRSVTLFLFVAVMGCSATPSKSASDYVAAPAISDTARNLKLPFDTYKRSLADVYLIEAAEDTLMQDCLKEKGIGWALMPRIGSHDVDPPNRQRYGIIEPEVAKRFGYHMPPDAPQVARHAAEKDDRRSKLNRRERTAAYGASGTGGCWSQARGELLKHEPKGNYDRLQGLSLRIFRASRKDAGVRRSFLAWSACMREKGFRYRDPLDAASDSRWYTSETPSMQEQDAATTDVRCKLQTGVVAVWSMAETRMQQAVIHAHAAEFRDFKASKCRYLEAARRVLSRRAGRGSARR